MQVPSYHSRSFNHRLDGNPLNSFTTRNGTEQSTSPSSSSTYFSNHLHCTESDRRPQHTKMAIIQCARVHAPTRDHDSDAQHIHEKADRTCTSKGRQADRNSGPRPQSSLITSPSLPFVNLHPRTSRVQDSSRERIGRGTIFRLVITTQTPHTDK